MAAACNCNATLNNTGTPGCPNIFDTAYKLIFTSYYTSTGTVNEWTISGTLNAAAFTALVSNADSYLKWFPSPEIDNVVTTRNEPVLESLASGKQIFVRDGVRNMTWSWINLDTIFLGKIEATGCKDFGVFVVDNSGNIIGMKGSTESTKLKPIKIDKDTFYSLLEWKGYETSQKINGAFQWDSGMQDADLRMVKASELSSYDAKDITGLIDIIGNTATSITTTSFVMIMNTYYGTPLNPIRVKGLVAGDFSLYNVTDSSSVTIASCTEGTGTNAGSYTFTWSGALSAKVLRLSCSKAGYDDSVLETATITTP